MIMRLKYAVVLAISVAMVAASGAAALDHHEGTPEATPDAVSTGAAYLVVTNNGDEDDAIVSASTDVAMTVELHTIDDDDGVMTMRPLERIEIPVGESVSLEPGGLHIMLIGLVESLEPGSSYSLTLEFERAGTVDLEVPVFVDEMEAMDAVTGSEAVTAGNLEISGVWSRQSPAMGGMDHEMDDSMDHDEETDATEGDMDHDMDMSGSTGAVYLVIENAGSEGDVLLGGSTAVAGTVEIHEIGDDEGMMQMRPLADGLEIPGGETVTFEPGGYHVMLIGLTQDLVAGESFDITLTFANAGDVELQAMIGMGNEPPDEGLAEAVDANGLIISQVWSRAAPMIE